jgi:hypothetical protein
MAIGQCLKDQYEARATPMPPRLITALVKQLPNPEVRKPEPHANQLVICGLINGTGEPISKAAFELVAPPRVTSSMRARTCGFTVRPKGTQRITSALSRYNHNSGES